MVIKFHRHTMLLFAGLLISIYTLHCDQIKRSDSSIVPPADFDISQAPNIVLISIDTFRADHMGAYGYTRNTTPVLDSITARGIRYEYAISQAPWTLSSMASILTSLYPSEHGATLAKSKISQKTLLISEMMQQIGYHTIGVITHNFVDDKHGFNQGFNVFDMENMKGHDAITSQDVVATARRQLDADTGGKPIFLWVHFFDPHFSFVRHREYGFADGYVTQLQDTITFDDLRITGEVNKAASLTQTDIEYVRAVYDEEIAYTDAWIGKLLAHRKLKSSIVFVTADHGTYFRERGRFFHGKDVYDALVHVPLIIGGSIPDSIRGHVVKQAVEVSSIPRTIEQIIGFSDFRFPGTDLMSLVEMNDAEFAPFVYTEGNYAWGTDERKTGVIHSRWKLIYSHDPKTYELYDRSGDASELNDLWMSADTTIDPIKHDLQEAVGLFPPREKAKGKSIRMDKNTMERLRSLGYVK